MSLTTNKNKFPIFVAMCRCAIITTLFVFCQAIAYGQSPTKALKHFAIKNKGETINCYVTIRDITKQKPLLLYLDGSGDVPLFRYKVDSAHKSSMMYSTVTFNYDSMAAFYHVVFISKPSIQLVDTTFVESLDSNVEYATPVEYTNVLSAEWRANAGSLVINYLLHKLPVQKNKVVAMGYSEGAQVAPHVAAINKHVTHVVCFSGNGLNQFYDFVIQERLKAVSGEISETEAQNNVDTLLTTFKDIYAHPDATDKMWAGHSYLRWASFCATDPIDYLLQLDIPIYFARGTSDVNTQILSTDYVQLEFLRRGKTNLTFKPYPNHDHFFRKINKDGTTEDHLEDAMNDAFRWLSKQ